MTTTWTDEEFASVSKALRYPSARDNVVVPGFPFDLLHQAWLLDAVLQRLSGVVKAEVVALASRINAAERAKWDAAGRAPDVTNVGDIRRDAQKGLSARSNVISEMRQRLSETIPFPINAMADEGAIGGVQGACC